MCGVTGNPRENWIWDALGMDFRFFEMTLGFIWDPWDRFWRVRVGLGEMLELQGIHWISLAPFLDEPLG